MKNTLKSLFALFLVTILFSCSKTQKKPNIILVITDDQGYGDISANGSPDVSTPNIDRLKGQAMSLEDFQVSPTCAPSRSAILTGRHPFKNGITHTILERERMALGITTLPEVLKKGGYTNGIFGKWHLGDEQDYQPENRGFDEVFIHGGGGIGQSYPGSCADAPNNKYFDPTIKHNESFVKTKGYCTDIFFKQALSWIKTNAEEEKPFFAYIATNAPHFPFVAPESYKKKFIEKDYLEDAQGFYGMIENIDDNLGLLMEKLNTWKIADNTILIFMSDNGKTELQTSDIHGKPYNAGMKGFKSTAHEGGTRVPFYIRWPGVFNAKEKRDALINHYDILPTLAEIAGVSISDLQELDGQSFLPYLKDESYKVKDKYRFFHSGRWPLNPKNINNQEINDEWVGTANSSNPDSSIYKNCAVRNEQYRFVNNKELYDIKNDPGELKNIASENEEIVHQMRKAYDSWWIQIRPYMVNEHVPLGDKKPFIVNHNKQVAAAGIKEWETPNLD